MASHTALCTLSGSQNFSAPISSLISFFYMGKKREKRIVCSYQQPNWSALIFLLRQWFFKQSEHISKVKWYLSWVPAQFSILILSKDENWKGLHDLNGNKTVSKRVLMKRKMIVQNVQQHQLMCCKTRAGSILWSKSDEWMSICLWQLNFKRVSTRISCVNLIKARMEILRNPDTSPDLIHMYIVHLH